ncbi:MULTISPECIES: hypothetical protein [unclassified Luteibacter]|jgi:hypothetical protein|uniref:hypothetical protein n=1 Tax=Luteibacter sp. PvP019 TaxID=3156436 RepID=UPI003395335E
MNNDKHPPLTMSKPGQCPSELTTAMPAITFDAMPLGPLPKGAKREVEGHTVQAHTSGIAFTDAPETYPNMMENTVITATGASECMVEITFRDSVVTVAVGVYQAESGQGVLTFLDEHGQTLGHYETIDGLTQYMYSSDGKTKTLRWTSRGGASLDDVYLLGV